MKLHLLESMTACNARLVQLNAFRAYDHEGEEDRKGSARFDLMSRYAEFDPSANSFLLLLGLRIVDSKTEDQIFEFTTEWRVRVSFSEDLEEELDEATIVRAGAFHAAEQFSYLLSDIATKQGIRTATIPLSFARISKLARSALPFEQQVEVAEEGSE